MALAFRPFGTAALEPGKELVAVTASDSVDITGGIVRSLWIGTGGNIAILCPEASAPVTLTNVPDGTLLRVMAKRIYTTGTTASGIVGIR